MACREDEWEGERERKKMGERKVKRKVELTVTELPLIRTPDPPPVAVTTKYPWQPLRQHS